MATREQLEIEAAATLLLQEHLDAHTRDLITRWGTAWDNTHTELEAAVLDLTTNNIGGTVTRTAALRSARLQAATAALLQALATITEQTTANAQTIAHAVITNSANATQRMIAAGLPGVRLKELRTSLTAADPQQILQMLERTTKTMHKRAYTLSAEAEASIKAQVLKSITVGDNPRKAARDAVRGIEDLWNGGLARANTLARTEIIDSHRRAAAHVEQLNKDVLDSWEWVAHLGAGKRTCRACISMHGTKHAIDSPGPLGHPNCRCARVPVTKTWEELGFPGVKEATSKTPDADAWFAKLSENDQREILTDAGYEAWAKGRWPRSAWATRRDNNGEWRSSYQAARAPAGKPFERRPFKRDFPNASPTWYPRQITPERPDEIAKRVNPGYGKDQLRSYNCFNAVTAYIMRQRGWDVTALPAENKDGKTFDKVLSSWQRENGAKPRLLAAKASESLPAALKRLVEAGAIPAGASGIAQVQWSRHQRLGHVVIWEVLSKGQVRIIDPQTGAIDNGKYIEEGALSGATNLFFRTDDATFIGEPTDWME